MEGMMKTAVMTGLEDVEIVRRPIPKPAAGEVLVKVEYVGVCGSDLHYYETGRIGDYVASFPFVLGHEAGGTVAELGKGVTNLAVGDRVALEPGKTCGQCEFCKGGKYNLCDDVIFFATPPIDGVFQEYVAHEAGLCFKVPDNMDSVEAALIEPLAVGMHAANQGGAHLGQTAVVTGAGCIGLCSMLSLRAMGVSTIILTDVSEARLAKARQLGADYVINSAKEDAVARIQDITDGKGQDLAIDTSGSEKAVSQLIQAAKKGSTVVFVGYSASGDMNLPVSVALNKELTFKSVFRYRNMYPMAIRAVADGKVPIKEIVTNYFELDDIKNALDSCLHNKDTIVKGVIKIA